jgi:hypothetical protein
MLSRKRNPVYRMLNLLTDTQPQKSVFLKASNIYSPPSASLDHTGSLRMECTLGVEACHQTQ